jgi:hypothetical protein
MGYTSVPWDLNDCTLFFYVQVVTGQIRQLLVEIKYGNSLTFLVT